MASINTAVKVNVDRQTAAVTVAGYSLAMFLGRHKAFTNRYKVYGSITEVAADFAINSPEYQAAAVTFGQEISVDAFAIGRQDTTTVTYTPVVANSATYSVTVNGTLFSYISDSSATAAEIVTGLTTAINADVALPVTASGSSTLILTADVGGVAFSAKATTNLTPVYAGTETLTDALNAIALENNDWYGLLAYTHVKADQIEIANYAQSARKFYKTSDDDLNIINQSHDADTTSVGKAFKNNGYDRAGVSYGGNADTQYPEAAYLGDMFSRPAGRATMEYKNLTSITVDNLTATQIANADAKNVTTYIPRGGFNTVHNPKMADGTFDDIIRDLDYAASDIEVSVFRLLVTLPKVPFTNKGIAVIESAVRDSVLRSANAGIFDPDDIVVTVPKVADVSANDRALRRLTGIKVVARMAGAIHYVEIDLTATV